jgi:hypothetical protein
LDAPESSNEGLAALLREASLSEVGEGPPANSDGAAAAAEAAIWWRRGYGISAFLRKDYAIAMRWRVQKKIGSGSFGEIYSAIGDKDERVAIKFEPTNTRHPQLLYEYKVYRCLRGGSGIPGIHYFGESHFETSFTASHLWRCSLSSFPSLPFLFPTDATLFALQVWSKDTISW